MFRLLKKTAYIIIFVAVLIFLLDIYINYKTDALLDDLQATQIQNATTVKDNFLNGGFFD